MRSLDTTSLGVEGRPSFLSDFENEVMKTFFQVGNHYVTLTETIISLRLVFELVYILNSAEILIIMESMHTETYDVSF